MLGSLIMLITIIAFYYKANLHTFSIPALMNAQIPLGFQKIAFFFLFISLVLVILAPVYMMFALPTAIEKDYKESDRIIFSIFDDLEGRSPSPFNSFSGSQVADNIIYDWGPDTGWFLCAAGAVSAAVASYNVFMRVSEPKRTVIDAHNIKVEPLEENDN